MSKHTATMQSETLPGLQPHHIAELRKSGLSDETIRACGFHSEDNYAKLAALLNRDGRRFPKKLSPALVFPFRGPEGSNGYCRIKPDTPRRVKGKPANYESPVGRANEVYIPPGTLAELDNPTMPMLVTEGEKKSAKGDQEGFPCLGLVGVFGWKTGKAERLLPALDRITWKGREVFIVFDSDLMRNPDIQDAEARLAAQLVNRGAKVRVVRLPDGPDGERWGLDDFLVARDADALRTLLHEAEAPPPIEAIDAKIPGNLLGPATEAGEFLNKGKRDGVFRLQFWRGSFYWWRKGAYGEFDRDVVRGEVIRYLNRHAKHLSASVVNNIIDQLKARAALPWQLDAPAWLGEPGPWPAGEILVAHNGLFHLPSIFGGKDCHLAPTPKLFSLSARRTCAARPWQRWPCPLG